MEVAEHISALRREGDLLVRAAAAADLDADVPRCPGWTVRDLLRHVGGVHRWARAHVAGARREPLGDEEVEEVMRAPSDDGRLTAWLREGCEALVAALESAPPDLECWSFLPARSPLAFWARRQAHETGIHRVDAEAPRGRITPFEPAVAADGIDELLRGFAARRAATGSPGERTLLVEAPDAGSAWLVTMTPQRTAASALSDGARPDADCRLGGRATDVFLFLWNRADRDGLDVEGDAGLLELWRETFRVRWA
jgi:uncharacterized protein (TIGR03083 family)